MDYQEILGVYPERITRQSEVGEVTPVPLSCPNAPGGWSERRAADYESTWIREHYAVTED
jgi:hypothetical protein